jgi:RNase P/RNase MRP subunit POP5
MKVYITGKAENISNREIRDAVYFYLKRLLGDSMSRKITLDIVIEKDLLKTYEMYAAISPLEADPRPKHYELEIDAKLPKKQFLVSLAHEMIHLKQFAKDQMRDLETKKMTRWLGEYYVEENIDYWARPWEKEAHDNEIGLYEQYLSEKDK